MLQVIALASIAAVVLTVTLFALVAANEPAERVGVPHNSGFHGRRPQGFGTVAGQPGSYQPIVNLNVVLPFSFSGNERDAREALARALMVPRPVSTETGYGPVAEYLEGTARVVEGYRRPQGEPHPALPAPGSEWHAQLDITA